ncbi:cytochrome P450 20A1-like [Halichondria panicea]|uniref:cytochrome P450 20A1-like n=1 Tax=Halichondria panicea TaxID=6063 RepID=UPI00312B418A
MLDFVIFAFTAVVGLIVILLFCYFSGSNSKAKPVLISAQSTETIPRWNEPPAHEEKGDLEVMMTKYGSLHQFLLHLHDNGRVPVSSFWWGKTHVVTLCSPQAFKESVLFVNRPRELFWGFEPLITKYSIQYANDEDWVQRSKLLFPTLKGEDLKSYFPHFVQIALETEVVWENLSSTEEVLIRKHAFPIAIKGITRSCLGDIFENDDELRRLTDAYHICWRTMEEGAPESGSERERLFLTARGVIEEIIRKIVAARREGKGHQDIPFIDAMLQHYDSDDKITADVISFLVGGFHTSGYMITWLLWYLADNPQSQDRLCAEIVHETSGGRGDALQQYALRTDTYLRQVQDETIRLSTLAPWAARYAAQDVGVVGYKIPRGTPMIHALGVGLKNQVVWGDTVDKWDPDRFDPKGRRGNEFCPFGVHSKRKCPGYQFSYFEVGVIISILLQRFTIVPVPGQDVIQVHGLVTEPRDDIRVYITSRDRGD